MDRKHEITTAEELPLALTIEQLAQVLRIGRGSAYRLAQTGELRTIKIGRQFVFLKRNYYATWGPPYDDYLHGPFFCAMILLHENGYSIGRRKE